MSLALDLEASLQAALEKHLVGPDGKTPANLAESIRYSLLAPGKRIRPRLSLACAKMIGLSREAALPAALSLELLHCFTLIHDDLPCMDNDDFRRGKPSNHKVFGEAIALLAGDALMSLAVDCFLDSSAHADATLVIRALRRLNGAIGPRGVMGGQAAEALVREKPVLEDMRIMHTMKTGALFSAALLVPMDLGGIAEESPQGRSITYFASQLGLAFQAVDDLEDEGKTPDPTSILYYLSADETRHQTREQLQAAMKGLSANWGAGAAALNAIADEVLQKV